MKIKLGTSAAIIAAMSLPALGADLPSRRAPPVFVPAAPIFSWAGFYLGGQVGYAFGQDRTVGRVPGYLTTTPGFAGDGEGGFLDGEGGGGFIVPPVTTAVLPATVTGISSPHGIIGGGHAGYNYVLPAFGGIGTGLILGIEGSVDGSDYRSSTSYFAGNALLNAGSSSSIRANIQGSIRGRLGIAFNQALFYATGGAAFADFRTTTNDFGVGADTFYHSRVGYTIGGGIEYAILPQVSVRVEYRYSDFGTFTDYLGNSAAVAGTSISHRETENIVQAGVSYHFQTPAPVVARY